jgi:hypothetical protein
MAKKQSMRPASNNQAPDPSDSYERSHPENEAGMGDLNARKTTPRPDPDRMDEAVDNVQEPDSQVAGEDLVNQRAREKPQQPDHSMKEEEPLGWDQAPTDIHDPKQKRHPRKEGKGGVS